MERTSVCWRKSTYSGNNGTNCVEVGNAPWRKSTYSGNNGGDCVEVGTAPWRKSTHSGNNGAECVEVATAAPGAGRQRVARQGVVVRDTTDRAGAVLSFPVGAWQAFAATLRTNA